MGQENPRQASFLCTERELRYYFGCDGSVPDGRCGIKPKLVILFDFYDEGVLKTDIPILACSGECALYNLVDGTPEFPGIIPEGLAFNIRIMNALEWRDEHLHDN